MMTFILDLIVHDINFEKLHIVLYYQEKSQIKYVYNRF